MRVASVSRSHPRAPASTSTRRNPMDLIKKLIAFVMTLFGRKPSLLAAGISQAEKAKIKSSSLKGLEELTGAQHVHVHGTGDDAKVVKRADGADLIEEDGEQL